MKLDPALAARLQFLVRVVQKEARYLLETDARLFSDIENLDRAEKLGWLESVDTWLEMRKLRNQMVHEYIEDLVISSSALRAGHAFVPVLIASAHTFILQAQQRLRAASA